ncbi:MAG: ABC transporter ATP-binding protein [Acidobacteriota bacterium]|jgi:ABC-2 type transport system ATP-binding protein
MPSEQSSPLALETRGLTRDFGELRAVDGIDLEVPQGSLYGFLGPNGAGKSTTIKCLTGLLRPTAGTVRILGRDPLADPVAVKRRLGVIPEDLALFDRLTGAENLAFVGRIHGLDPATVESRVHELLDLFDLADAAGTLVADYSHGMRKKVSLAAALLPSPRLLFLDEPFEGIDAVSSRQIKRLLQDFVGRGGTIFLTSHVLEIVERLASHVGIIHRGKLVAQGPIEELWVAEEGETRSLEDAFLGAVGALSADGVLEEKGGLSWLGSEPS